MSKSIQELLQLGHIKTRYIVFVRPSELKSMDPGKRQTFKTLEAAKQYCEGFYTDLGAPTYHEEFINHAHRIMYSREYTVADHLGIIEIEVT